MAELVSNQTASKVEEKMDGEESEMVKRIKEDDEVIEIMLASISTVTTALCCSK